MQEKITLSQIVQITAVVFELENPVDQQDKLERFSEKKGAWKVINAISKYLDDGSPKDINVWLRLKKRLATLQQGDTEKNKNEIAKIKLKLSELA